jgi:hypothetical protein
MISTEFASFLPASVGPTGLARANPPYAPTLGLPPSGQGSGGYRRMPASAGQDPLPLAEEPPLWQCPP